MRYPNKITSYKESVLKQFPIILNELEKKDMTIIELLKKTKKKFSNTFEFIEVLDCLFALHKIELNEETGRLYYVV